ncbi:MAG TPA: Uma2 family endonuclease [Gemmataceae bacterium]|jgi:Uma2 family endonuclease|nr:Uma2 family endonuclease [Gemmataceae bacterium]
MATIVTDVWELDIPAEVQDLEAFRHWAHSDGFPEHGRIWWLDGKVWADMGQEQLFTHNLLKTQIAAVLTAIVDGENLGLLFGNGVLLSNFTADISGNPDATFLSAATLASDRVRLIEGAETGFVEIQGSPDMVLEVVSRSSKQKDQVLLRRAYWEAGIREYWLADARGTRPTLEILRCGSRGYIVTKPVDGWIRSPAFGRSFQLTQSRGVGGYPRYRLNVR